MRELIYVPPEQIVSLLHEAEALLASGKTVAETTRVLGISELRYYLWRQEYGEQLASETRGKAREAAALASQAA